MKIVDYNTTSHTLRLVPRYYPSGDMSIDLFNESINEHTIVACTYSELNGYLLISFTFTFENKDRYSFTILEGTEVVYRGKIYSTIEPTQNYKQSYDIYEY